MPATFQLIDANELIDFLKEHQFVESESKHSERCFERIEKIGKMTVSIFFLTTLSVGAILTRHRATDAMRLWVIGYDAKGGSHRISKVKTFHRTQGWRKNLSNAFNKWSELVKYRCYTCNTPLVFRVDQRHRLYCCYCNP